MMRSYHLAMHTALACAAIPAIIAVMVVVAAKIWVTETQLRRELEALRGGR